MAVVIRLVQRSLEAVITDATICGSSRRLQTTRMLATQSALSLWSVRTSSEYFFTQLPTVHNLSEWYPARPPMHVRIAVDCDCIVKIPRHLQMQQTARAHDGPIRLPALGNKSFLGHDEDVFREFLAPHPSAGKHRASLFGHCRTTHHLKQRGFSHEGSTMDQKAISPAWQPSHRNAKTVGCDPKFGMGELHIYLFGGRPRVI